MPLGEFSSDDLAAEIWAMTEREEPNLTRAFLLALGSLLGISSIVRLTRMIDDGEVMSVTDVVSDALSQVTIPPESFAAVQESVMQQAGELTAAAVDVGQPYDGVAPRAMAASGNITAYLVRHVNDVVRENLRRIISDQVNGAITRSEALRRIRQEVGLLPQHAQAVQNLEANLLASGLSPAQVQARSAAYADRLLRYRAEMISRTETARAASVGQQEYWEQLADDSLLPPNTMRQWIVTPDEKLCDICGPMEHLLVPLDGFWELNNGDQVYYPTDSHPNCRCSMGLFFPDQLGKADPLGLQRWLAMRPTIVKHASHDQKSHGNWARGRSAVPPRPGTTPIPEGHIRLYHYTRAGADVIREQGLKLSESRGETYGEPNLVWASGQQPGEFKTYVEFSVPIGDPRFAIGKPTEISPDSDYEGKYVAPDGRAYNVSPEGFRSDVGFIGGIKPEEFIAVHEPWHHRYRYMVEEGMTDAVLAGDWDDLMNDPSNPDYGKAIRQIYADAGISKHAQHDQKSHGNWARGKAEEYQGQHAPPEDAAPLHDLLAEGTWFPDDVYTHPQFYVHGDDDVVAESLAAIREARGNPDALITVYRSVPPGVTSINTGDWVALSRTYAENHGAERDREYWDADREWTIEGPTPETSASGVGQWVSYDEPRDWPVLEAKVPARLILNGGNDLIEWGYWGPDAEDGEVVSKHANHDQKSHGNWARGGRPPGIDWDGFKISDIERAKRSLGLRPDQEIWQHPAMKSAFWGGEFPDDEYEAEWRVTEYTEGEWAKFGPARQIRDAAEKLLGLDEPEEDDPTLDPYQESNLDATWGGGEARVSDDVAKVMALLLLDRSTPIEGKFYRGTEASVERMGLSEGDEFDVGLLSFTDSPHTAASFGGETVFVVENPVAYRGQGLDMAVRYTAADADEFYNVVRTHAERDELEEVYGEDIFVVGEKVSEDAHSSLYYEAFDYELPNLDKEHLITGSYRIASIDKINPAWGIQTEDMEFYVTDRGEVPGVVNVVTLEPIDRDGDGIVLEGTDEEKFVGKAEKSRRPAWLRLLELPLKALADSEGVKKHASHDQKSHGNWARGGGVPGGSVVDGHWVPGSPPPGSNERGVKDWERGLELFKERPELFRAKVLADDGLPVPESEEPSYAPGAYDELSDPDDQSALITIGRAINQAWEGEITRAIALNKIDPGNPEELGGNSLVDTRSEAYQRYGYDAKPERGTWKELPDELFHVTTNLGALQEGGFKTRDQLASEMGENPAGLGGGVSDAISFTTDPPIVDAIVRGIHELREAVRDDTGPAAVERMKAEIASWDTADERDGRTGLSGTQKLLAENPSSMEERGEFYKSFSYFRQFNVPNRPDPLFFNPNYQAFADLDPAEVGVVTISPSVAGAKGWQVEGMGEWRTIPEAVEIVAAEARDGDGDGFVLDGTNQERPVSKHANHDQKSHGNWAKGADRFDPRPYIEWKGRGRTSARAAVFHLWADHSKIEPILDEIDLLEAGGEVKETANGMAAAFIQAKLQENNPLANEPAFYRGTRTDRIPEPGETFEMKVRSWGGSADDAHRFTSFGGRTDGVPVLYEVLPEDRKQFMVMDTTRWRWDENKLAEVVGGGKFRVVGTRKFGSTDTTVVQVVQEEGAIATPIVKHASHDQKSHGNWAKGKFVPNETGQKSLDLIEEFDWKSKGMLGAKPTYQKLAKAGKPVFPSQPGAGTRVFTKRAGELPGKAMARNEAGEMEVVDITISGPLRGGHQLSPKQTQFILDTLNKISPEFRPTHVRVDAGRTIGGGWYVHGQDSFLKNEIHISAWMIPGVLSIPEMDQIYRDDLEFALVTGKDLEDVSRWKKYIWTLQTQTTEKAWAHFEKTIIHETGHAVETRLWASHLSAEENWRSEVSSDWVYKSREFFNEHFHFVGNRDVAGAGRYRNGPGDQHYYLAATNRLGETALADSLDKRHEDEDRWAADARADSELFAEWFRFGVEGLPFPNGHIIDEFVGGLVDGDGDGFVLDGTDQERRA